MNMVEFFYFLSCEMMNFLLTPPLKVMIISISVVITS